MFCGGIRLMPSNELIIFKKDTDAPGSNRGFVYQYLKTLVLWLRNYKENVDVTIYCEVEDDIKEINLLEKTLRFTQLKCYSSALNINSDEIKKSLYNFFILHLIYDDYDGKYVFETNTYVSNRDTIIENWMEYQGALHMNEAVQLECVVKTKEILREVFSVEKNSLEQAIEKKIMKRKEKLEKAFVKSEEILKEIEALDEELKVLQELSESFEAKIDDETIMCDFVNRVSWVFEDIDAIDSIDVLKKQAEEILADILEDKSRVDLYFCRLLSEINFKAVKEKKEQRYLDKKLLDKILKETDDEIRSYISNELIQKFEGFEVKLDRGVQEIKDEIHELGQKVDSLSSTVVNGFRGQNEPKYELYELPPAEPEDIKQFIKQENNENQSNLEGKIHRIEGLDEDKPYMLDTATAYRCRYLMYLDRLKVRNFSEEYNVIKKLETNVQRICTNAVLEFSSNRAISPSKFYVDFQNQLKNVVKEFNEMVKVKKIIVDEEIVYGQMFHMAAKCFLRWHRER